MEISAILTVLEILGGLGLFLYGMNVMGDNLKKLAGGKLEKILASLTSNKWKGFLLGLVVTSVIQSSSATIAMVIGFVNSGMMQFGQTFGILLGANLGTTATAWLISLDSIGSAGTQWLDLLKPTAFTPLMMIVGVGMTMLCKSDKKKDVALILVGFAALMFGMDMMSDALSGLKDSETFGDILTMFSHPLMGILIGTALTALIQSSSASVGVLQALSTTGAITFSTAIPIILGQNIGAAITPFLSAINGNTDAKRVAFANLYIKIIGVAVVCAIFYALDALFAFAFMDQHVNMVTIAIVHSLFNIINSIVMLPFTRQIEKLTVSTIRSRKATVATPFDILDERFLAIPTFAIDKCRELVCEMAGIAQTAVCDSIGLLSAYDRDIAVQIEKNEDLVDTYEDRLSTHLVKISSGPVSAVESRTVTKLFHCIGDIERIADHSVNITDLAQELDDKGHHFSEEAVADIRTLSMAVKDILAITTTAFRNDDLALARTVEPLEEVIDKLTLKTKDNHILRLQNGRCSIELGFVLSELLNNFERIADHCSNIAVCMIEIAHGSLDTHEYLSHVKTSDEEFLQQYNAFKTKYIS